MKLVGIDAIEIAVPRLYIHYKELAEARRIDPAKLKHGIGVEKMAIPDADEDVATLAADATLSLLRQTGLTPEDIGRFTISTESSLDEAKALNAYVIGMLEEVYGRGSFVHCGGTELKFACVAGSYGLHDAANWIRAGENGGKAAVVVASDVAKYALGSPGEYTQGGGAVAMLVKEEPRLLALDPKVASAVVSNDRDFFRPMGYVTPVFDGHYSNWAYLVSVAKAFHRYKQKAQKTGLFDGSTHGSVLEQSEYVLFHLPYPKMAKNAFAYLVREDMRDLPQFQFLLQEIGMSEPLLNLAGAELESLTADKALLERDNAFRKSLMQTSFFQETFLSKVNSSLYAGSQLGNLYSAAIFMSLASLVNALKEKGKVAGKRVLFCSYGSGSSAMAYSGIIQPGYLDAAENLSLNAALEGRQPLDFQTYERLHKGAVSYNSPISAKHKYFALKNIGTEGVKTGYREYRFTGTPK